MRILLLLPLFLFLFSCEPEKKELSQPCEEVVLTHEDSLRKNEMESELKFYLGFKRMTDSLAKARGGMAVMATAAPDTIPVCVHVLWHLPEENISDAQIFSQIDALNKDFSATNEDIVNVPDAFKPFIGNANLYFKLARRTADGKPTNGIVRKYTDKLSFSSDGNVCLSSMGGDDMWPNTSYINVWVCNKTGAGAISSCLGEKDIVSSQLYKSACIVVGKCSCA
jgi:hypothetical protein